MTLKQKEIFLNFLTIISRFRHFQSSLIFDGTRTVHIAEDLIKNNSFFSN